MLDWDLDARRDLAPSDDVADLVGFLISDKAAHITRQTITVDGGGADPPIS